SADVDSGPIIAQGAVPVLPDDSESTLAARVLAVEHRLLPAAVGWHCAGRLVIDGAHVRVDFPIDRPDDALTVPRADALPARCPARCEPRGGRAGPFLRHGPPCPFDHRLVPTTGTP